jgi:two-component system invasion response regulator UvrY
MKVVLKGLKEIILEGFHDATIDLCSKGYELLAKISNNDYDIVLLDISLPDINGLEVLKEIKKLKRKLPVLVLSMYPEENYAARAIKGGAQGYLTKGSASDDLLQAVRKILSGKKYVSPAFAERMVLDFESDTGKPLHESLSNRELQVLSMIGAGKAVKEIAGELHLSANTVRTFRSRILEKIGVKGTSELIHYAIAQNLTEQ